MAFDLCILRESSWRSGAGREKLARLVVGPKLPAVDGRGGRVVGGAGETAFLFAAVCAAVCESFDMVDSDEVLLCEVNDWARSWRPRLGGGLSPGWESFLFMAAKNQVMVAGP